MMAPAKPFCLGFGVPKHQLRATLTLHIGRGTRWHAEIPLCDACALDPRVEGLLVQPDVVLS